MRNSMMAMTVALTLATGLGQAAPPKAPKPDVGAGRVTWFDITTGNLAQSKEFYGKLFDWTFAALKGTDLAAEIVSRGTSIGTIRVAEGKISPFNGVVVDQYQYPGALVEAGVEIHYLENPPFPMTEFTLKAKRIQYAAGNPAMVARLREVVGR